MHIYIIFAHPSHESFTHDILESFIKGLQDAGHSFEIGDLYAMNFQSDMTLAEYDRETSLNADAPLSEDVQVEHAKIDKADALTFIYPVWWSDCPAKLKGWFDRVWSYGYAYLYDENREHATPEMNINRSLVICPAGHTEKDLEEIGIAESMRRIMINDRLSGIGVREATLEILGGMTLGDETIREDNLNRAYQLGKSFS